MEEKKYDFIFKIILIGESQVGKTNIMSKFLRNYFDENSRATMGLNLVVKPSTLMDVKSELKFGIHLALNVSKTLP